MTDIFFSLGSNVGDRSENLEKGFEELKKGFPGKTICSSVYETEPWGKADQDLFLNQVIWIKAVNIKSDQALDFVLQIERGMGRIREEKWGPRIIDIDILFFGSEIIKTEELTIPHPEIQNRKFILAPLAEIDPDLKHPVLKKTMAELLKQCSDSLEVHRL